MTRKKYSRDTYYEELENELLSSTSEEEEEDSMSEDEMYECVCQYLHHEIDIQWIKNWVDASDFLELFLKEATKQNFRDFINRNDRTEYQMCDRLRGYIHHMCITLKVKPERKRLQTVLCGLLSIRDKFMIVHPQTQRYPMHWTRQWANFVRLY